MEEQRFYFKDVLFIVLGSCIYAFGLLLSILPMTWPKVVSRGLL